MTEGTGTVEAAKIIVAPDLDQEIAIEVSFTPPQLIISFLDHLSLSRFRTKSLIVLHVERNNRQQPSVHASANAIESQSRYPKKI